MTPEATTGERIVKAVVAQQAERRGILRAQGVPIQGMPLEADVAAGAPDWAMGGIGTGVNYANAKMGTQSYSAGALTRGR